MHILTHIPNRPRFGLSVMSAPNSSVPEGSQGSSSIGAGTSKHAKDGTGKIKLAGTVPFIPFTKLGLSEPLEGYSIDH